MSRQLATALEFTYLDTGAMYRAIAYGCQQAGVDADDVEAVARYLAGVDIQLQPADKVQDDVLVFLNGLEVGTLLRTAEMGLLASKISALSVVRQKLTAMQQAMGRAGQIVAEGRDTGTVVFPEAAWKFYLDATAEERARRRTEQLQSQGQEVDPEEILAQIVKRDRDDSERTIAPLKAAVDAVRIDSSRLSASEVVEKMMAYIQGKKIEEKMTADPYGRPS